MKKTANKQINKGDKVTWKWGRGVARGTVDEIHPEKTTRSIKGAKVTRKGTNKNPALIIKQKDGQRVMKAKREVKSASKQ